MTAPAAPPVIPDPSATALDGLAAGTGALAAAVQLYRERLTAGDLPAPAFNAGI